MNFTTQHRKAVIAVLEMVRDDELSVEVAYKHIILWIRHAASTLPDDENIGIIAQRVADAINKEPFKVK